MELCLRATGYHLQYGIMQCVTCHRTQVNTPCLNLSQTVSGSSRIFIYTLIYVIYVQQTKEIK